MTHLYPSHSAKSTSGDEALTSLMRTIRMNESTIEMGADICERLNRQGQQINGVMKSLADIDKKVDACEAEVGKMNSMTGLGFWHAVGKFFSRTPKVKNTISKVPPAKTTQKQKQQQLATQPKSAVENQIDAALNIVDSQIKQIKGMAVQIKAELGYHNEMLDTANNAASIATNNITHVTDEEEKML